MPQTDPQTAWAPFEPRTSAWNTALAGHLLRRATFGFTAAQLQQALADGPAKTIDRLLAPPPDYAAFEQNAAALVPPEASPQDAGEVWLYRMQNTPYPLLEKTTLFWYNFFGVSGSRVPQAMLMERHIEILRKHALGRYDQMLPAVSHDPAAVIANPMFNRGAFSGATVLRGEYRYEPARHQGDVTPDDAIRQALARPETSPAVVRRLCRWLVGSATLPPPLVTPLAEGFSRDYDIAKLVSTILRSNLFFSPTAYRQDIKSPVEFALNLAVALNVTLAPAQLRAQLAALGQHLSDLPSLAGWPGGRRWLNAFTIVGRGNLAAAILIKAEHYPDRRTLLETLLQNDAPPAVLQGLAQYDGRELAQAIANLPEFQLG